MNYGYARVSSKEQNEQRQMIALTAFGIAKRIFTWTSSPEKTLTVPDTSVS